MMLRAVLTYARGLVAFLALLGLRGFRLLWIALALGMAAACCAREETA